MIDTLIENKTIIRQTTIDDLDRCLDLIREFREESLLEYGVNLNEQLIRDTVYKYLNSSFVAEVNGRVVGILAGYTMNIPTVSTLIYQEEVWYASKEHRSVGVRLLRHLEQWCKQNGITHIIMGSLLNSKHKKLTDFYIRLSYMPMQISYIKFLSGGSDALSQ